MSRAHPAVADCGAFFSLAISPDGRRGDEAGRRWWVGGAVRFRIGHLAVDSRSHLDARKHRGPGTQTMVLSETRPEAGLTLLRVWRGGLELGECLGETAGRADDLLETAPRTGVRGFGSQWRGDHPAPERSKLPR